MYVDVRVVVHSSSVPPTFLKRANLPHAAAAGFFICKYQKIINKSGRPAAFAAAALPPGSALRPRCRTAPMPVGGVGRQNANDTINSAKRNYHTLGNAVTMRSSAPLRSGLAHGQQFSTVYPFKIKAKQIKIRNHLKSKMLVIIKYIFLTDNLSHKTFVL
jgi:hypothetical protein